MSKVLIERQFVVPDPRHVLAKQYELEGKLPLEIGDKLFATIPDMERDLKNHGIEVERKILSNFLSDKRIRPKTKENVAKAILTGNYDVEPEEQKRKPSIPKLNPISAVKAAESRAKQLLNLRRHELPKPHFLELSAESSYIPLVSMKDVRQEKLQRIRHTHKGITSAPAYNVHETQSSMLDSIGTNTHLEESDELSVHFETNMANNAEKQQAESARTLYTKLMLEDRKKKLLEWREKIIQQRKEIEQQSKLAKLTIEKRVEIKKKLNLIRSQIREHLEKKKDPMRGEIMRCIDESLIYYIVEKYDGLSMSVEAILALISNAMGTTLLTPDADIVASSISSTNPGQPDLNLAIKSTTLASTHTYLASNSMELSHYSMINNYKSFGKRSPSPIAALAKPPSLSALLPLASPLPYSSLPYNSTLEDQFYSRPTGQSDVVRGVLPRTYSAPVTIVHHIPAPLSASGSRSRPTSPERTLGSGYRINRSQSPLHPAGGERSIVVMSSEHIHRIAREMGFDTSRAVTADEIMHTVENEQHKLAERRRGQMEDKEAAKAISIMHEQLLEEGLLPSLQPERVLTGEQLDDLGRKKKTWDDVFREISRGYGAKTMSEEEMGRGGEGGETDKIVMLENASAGSSAASLIDDMIEGELHLHRVKTPSLQSPGREVVHLPHSPTAYSLNTKPPPFFGSLAQKEEEKIRLLSFAENEKVEAEKRLLLPSLRPPEIKANPAAEMTPLQLLSLPREDFDALNAPLLVKGPRAIKSREGTRTKEKEAMSPYKSWAEEMAVLTHGVASGAGLRLYRPRGEVTGVGRYRASHGQHTLRQKGGLTGPKKVPFVSAT